MLRSVSRSARPHRPPLLLALPLALALTGCAAAPHLLESSPEGGFAIYRTGRVDRDELAALCRRGVEELVVMDGSAVRRECAWREAVCPGLVVRYDRRQDVSVPLSAPFLEAFDRWVETARRAGRKIAFRCHHGWHRAGRLSAYYRMRFQHLTAEDARTLMLQHGRFMWRHPYLKPQVTALADHLAGRPCSTAEQHCVRRGPEVRGEGAVFAADVCPPAPGVGR